MSIKKTQVGLIKHLQTLSPALPTAYEGVSFTPPTGMYQRVQFRISKPDDPVLGQGYYRERLEIQVFVYGAINKGTGEVLDRAEMLRQHFKKGTFLLEQQIPIHVLETPAISGTVVIGDRILCPVIITAVAEIST